MSTADFSVFFALLSLACWAATVVVVVLAIVASARRDGEVALLFDDVRCLGLWLRGWSRL